MRAETWNGMCRDINSKWFLLGKLNRKSFHPHSPRRNCSPRSAGAETHSSNGAPLPGGRAEALVRGAGQTESPVPSLPRPGG